MSTRLVHILLLTLLTWLSIIPLLSADMYLPAMPDIALSLATDENTIQRTLSLYLLGLTFAQLAYGPLSDRYGRKPLLLCGLIIYCLATLGCLLTHSASAFIWLRFIQAIGACAGSVLVRAIVADRFNMQDSIKIFAVIFAFVGLTPAIAPVIGGYLTESYGWRTIFMCLLAVGIIVLFITAFFFKESSSTFSTESLHPIQLTKSYLGLTRNPRFMGYIIILCCAYAAYFTYLVEATFVFNHIGLSPTTVGYLYIAVSVPYIMGNILSKRLSASINTDHALLCGIVIASAGGLALLLVSFFAPSSVLLIIASICFVSFGDGIIVPVAVGASLSQFQTQKGLSSAFLGASQMGTAFLATLIVSTIVTTSPRPMATVMFICLAASLIAYFFLIHRTRNEIHSPSLN